MILAGMVCLTISNVCFVPMTYNCRYKLLLYFYAL